MTIERFVSDKLGTPRTRPFSVVAQDPSVAVSDRDPRVLTSVVDIPSERYLPGPRGVRFQVVDLDTASSKVGPQSEMPRPGTRPEDDWVARAVTAGTFDEKARAQNVYVVAARTLARFEQSLGRRIPWSFPGHQLYLVPAAMQDAQAFYDPGSQAILFGWFPQGRDRRAYTSLSYDVIAHETTHAILDGMRSRFTEPGLPDQAAFHEALADIVALLSVFSMKEVPQRLLDRSGENGFLPADNLSIEALQENQLFGLAEELGAASDDHHGDALRRSVKTVAGTAWKSDARFREPHRRGEIVVAAVAQAMLRMWHERLQRLAHDTPRISATLAAEEGAKAAEHLLSMCIRAIDYTPPIEFLFEDFLDAILAADREVAPVDDHDYRGMLTDAFRTFGIEAPPTIEHDVHAPEGRLDYSSIHLDELKNDPDEVFGFIWENAEPLGLKAKYYLDVETVEPARRVAPDGFIVYETVASYVQLLDGTYESLARLADEQQAHLPESQRVRFAKPPGLAASTPLQILGGGALVFDEFGRAKFHQRKSIFDWQRQNDRLAYLVEKNKKDTKGRFGFSEGTVESQRFRLLHLPADWAGERW